MPDELSTGNARAKWCKCQVSSLRCRNAVWRALNLDKPFYLDLFRWYLSNCSDCIWQIQFKQKQILWQQCCLVELIESGGQQYKIKLAYIWIISLPCNCPATLNLLILVYSHYVTQELFVTKLNLSQTFQKLYCAQAYSSVRIPRVVEIRSAYHRPSDGSRVQRSDGHSIVET